MTGKQFAILQLLATAESMMSAQDLIRASDGAVRSAHFHLNLMRDRGLISSEPGSLPRERVYKITESARAAMQAFIDNGMRKEISEETRRGLALGAQTVRTHGLSRTPEHRAWLAMRKRCSNPTVKGYENYGGRGISICERWSDFSAFYADMGPRPSPKHSIDRIDNNGHYGPLNCRWATKKQQQCNTRTTRFITHHGQTRPLSHWAQDYGLPRNVLRGRIEIGWDVERALTQPVQCRHRR